MPITAIAAPAPAPLLVARPPLELPVEEADTAPPERVADEPEPPLPVALALDPDAVAEPANRAEADAYKSEDAYVVQSDEAGTLG